MERNKMESLLLKKYQKATDCIDTFLNNLSESIDDPDVLMERFEAWGKE